MLTLIQKIISLVRKENSIEVDTILASLEQITESSEKETEILKRISFQTLNEFSLMEYRKQELVLTEEESAFFDSFFQQIEKILQKKSANGEKYDRPIDYKLYTVTSADMMPVYCHPPIFSNKVNTALLYE
jgi:hypothetical protein